MTEYKLDRHFAYELKNDPAFWKGLKMGDRVGGREVVIEAKDTFCGLPQLFDLMSDEGRGWMVCRAGFDYPECGCPHEIHPDMMEEEE